MSRSVVILDMSTMEPTKTQPSLNAKQIKPGHHNQQNALVRFITIINNNIIICSMKTKFHEKDKYEKKLVAMR